MRSPTDSAPGLRNLDAAVQLLPGAPISAVDATADILVSKTGSPGAVPGPRTSYAGVTQWQRTRLLSVVMGVRFRPTGTSSRPFSSVVEQPPRKRPTEVRSLYGAPFGAQHVSRQKTIPNSSSQC